MHTPPRRAARVRFTVISLGRRGRRWWRSCVKYGAVIVSALFYLHALTVAVGVWDQLRPQLFECGAPALSPAEYGDPERFSATASPAELPWAAAPPESLTSLWQRLASDRLISAFRITLPNPIWDEAHNVALAARLLSGAVIAPGQTVSVIGLAGPFTKERGYGDGPGYAGGQLVPVTAGGVCKIGTAMYNVAVHGGLTVVERHPHSMPVPYIRPGRDAAIAAGYKDVRVRNDYDRPVLLWAGMKETTLFVALYGDVEAPTVHWRHEELDRVPAPLERRANPALPPGQERIVFAGYDGVTVRTSITLERPGQPAETKLLSVDTYRPLRGVLEYGP